MALGLLSMLLVVFGVAGLGLFIWALVDCVQVPDDEMYQSGTKLIWVLVVLLAPFIGPIAYLTLGRPVSRV